MPMTNHEIALELVKLVLPDMLAAYKKSAPLPKPEDFANLMSTNFSNTLTALPPQGVGKNYSE